MILVNKYQYGLRLPVLNTKILPIGEPEQMCIRDRSMTGHLLGGAGGIESVFTVLALKNQVSPPTINIFNQDPECDLDYCANVAREMPIRYAMKNSFGFGGTNGSLIFGQV